MIDGDRHRLSVAGNEAALQQALEVGHVERPAVMAQHVGGDAARRFEAAGRPIGGSFGQQQFLGLQQGARHGRPAAGAALRRDAGGHGCGQRGSRFADAGEPAHEIVGPGIGVRRDLAGGLHLVEPGTHLVEAGQAQVDQGRAYRTVVRAHGRHHVLGSVHGARHGGEIDNSRGALQGMQGTKGVIQPFPVVRSLLQGEQVVLALGHQLATFDQELLEEFVHGARPHMTDACSASCCCVTGFTR